MEPLSKICALGRYSAFSGIQQKTGGKLRGIPILRLFAHNHSLQINIQCKAQYQQLNQLHLPEILKCWKSSRKFQWKPTLWLLSSLEPWEWPATSLVFPPRRTMWSLTRPTHFPSWTEDSNRITRWWPTLKRGRDSNLRRIIYRILASATQNFVVYHTVNTIWSNLTVVEAFLRVLNRVCR